MWPILRAIKHRHPDGSDLHILDMAPIYQEAYKQLTTASECPRLVSCPPLCTLVEFFVTTRTHYCMNVRWQPIRSSSFRPIPICMQLRQLANAQKMSGLGVIWIAYTRSLRTVPVWRSCSRRDYMSFGLSSLTTLANCRTEAPSQETMTPQS